MPSLLRSFEQGSSIQLLQSEQARQLQHSSPDPATHNEQGKKQRKKQREYGTPFRRIVGLGTARRVRVKDGSASSTPSFMAKIGTLNASDSRTPVGKARAIAAAYRTPVPGPRRSPYSNTKGRSFVPTSSTASRVAFYSGRRRSGQKSHQKNHNSVSSASRRPAWDNTNHDLTVHKLSAREQRRRKEALKSPHNALLTATARAVENAVLDQKNNAKGVTPAQSLRLGVAEAYAEADRRRARESAHRARIASKARAKAKAKAKAKAAKIKSFAASSGKKSTPRIRSPIPPSHSEPHHSTNDGGDEQSQPVDSEEDDIAVRLEREIAAFRQRKGITDPHMEKSLKSPTVAHSTGMNSALPPGCPNTATTPVSWSSRQTRTTLGTAQSPSMSSDMLVRMLTSLAEETEDLPVQQLAARLIATAEAVAEVGVRPAAVQSTRHALGTRLQGALCSLDAKARQFERVTTPSIDEISTSPPSAFVSNLRRIRSRCRAAIAAGQGSSGTVEKDRIVDVALAGSLAMVRVCCGLIRRVIEAETAAKVTREDLSSHLSERRRQLSYDKRTPPVEVRGWENDGIVSPAIVQDTSVLHDGANGKESSENVPLGRVDGGLRAYLDLDGHDDETEAMQALPVQSLKGTEKADVPIDEKEKDQVDRVHAQTRMPLLHDHEGDDDINAEDAELAMLFERMQRAGEQLGASTSELSSSSPDLSSSSSSHGVPFDSRRTCRMDNEGAVPTHLTRRIQHDYSHENIRYKDIVPDLQSRGDPDIEQGIHQENQNEVVDEHRHYDADLLPMDDKSIITSEPDQSAASSSLRDQQLRMTPAPTPFTTPVVNSLSPDPEINMSVGVPLEQRAHYREWGWTMPGDTSISGESEEEEEPRDVTPVRLSI